MKATSSMAICLAVAMLVVLAVWMNSNRHSEEASDIATHKLSAEPAPEKVTENDFSSEVANSSTISPLVINPQSSCKVPPVVRSRALEIIGDNPYTRLEFYEINAVAASQFLSRAEEVLSSGGRKTSIALNWALPIFDDRCTISEITAISSSLDGDSYTMFVSCAETGIDNVRVKIKSDASEIFYDWREFRAFYIQEGYAAAVTGPLPSLIPD